jgi:RNA polymerase sigma factor (sigma-70 family)
MDHHLKAPVASADVDALLLPFLSAATPEEEDLVLIQLLDDYINPIVRQILRHKLHWHASSAEGLHGSQDIEEAYHDIQVQLLERLRSFKAQPVSKSVTNLQSYVAAAARNACDNYLRRKYPQWRSLKDRIRYCLMSRSELALWEAPGRFWLAGLAGSDKGEKSILPDATRTRDHLLNSLSGNFRSVNLRHLELDHLIKAILQTYGSPIELDQLTSVVAELQGVGDNQVTSFDVDKPSFEQLASQQADPAATVECHELLEHLWSEIKLLPRRQRVALLCNLKNEQRINVITLFPAVHVATFEQIAEVLEISLEEFEVLWSKLPIDDLSLAKYLGITRQQIINLRRSARDRLLRRMTAFERERSY